MKFKSVNIMSWPSKGGFRIQWSIDGISASDSITIERSEGQEGPWLELTTLPGTTVSYEDCMFANNQIGFFRKFWYRITIKNDADELQLQSNALSTENIADPVTREIVRQHELLLYGVNGHPGYYSRDFACYKKQIMGERYEDSRGYNGEELLGFSDIDQNTGYKDGYADPMVFKGRWINSVEVSSVMQPTGRREEFNRQLWTTNYPVLEIGDLIVEKDTGLVYEVRSISKREPNGTLISQTANCSQMHPNTYEAQEIRWPS